LRSIISDRTKELWAQQNAGRPGDGDGEKGSSYSSVASSFEALSLESMYGRYVSHLDPKRIGCARLDHVKATMLIQPVRANSIHVFRSLPSLPRVTLPQMPSFPNMPALPFNMPAWVRIPFGC
jgi:hypothetical protein